MSNRAFGFFFLINVSVTTLTTSRGEVMMKWCTPEIAIHQNRIFLFANLCYTYNRYIIRFKEMSSNLIYIIYPNDIPCFVLDDDVFNYMKFSLIPNNIFPLLRLFIKSHLWKWFFAFRHFHFWGKAKQNLSKELVQVLSSLIFLLLFVCDKIWSL